MSRVLFILWALMASGSGEEVGKPRGKTDVLLVPPRGTVSGCPGDDCRPCTGREVPLTRITGLRFWSGPSQLPRIPVPCLRES